MLLPAGVLFVMAHLLVFILYTVNLPCCLIPCGMESYTIGILETSFRDLTDTCYIR